MKINAIDYLSFLEENFDRLSKHSVPLWHPLGFVSCLIFSKKGEFDIRVHFWPKGERRTKKPDWPIHTHSYALSSVVLTGRIRDIQYQAVDCGEHCAYKVKYFEGGSEMVKTDTTITLTESASTIHGPGEQYVVEQGIFHQSRVDLDKKAVTLVALSEMSKNSPLVMGLDAEVKYPYERLTFDPEFFWAEVRDAIITMRLSS